MPIIELSDEQLVTLKAIMEVFTESEYVDELAEQLELTDAERGKENEDGEENENYEEADDPAVKRVDEVAKIIEAA